MKKQMLTILLIVVWMLISAGGCNSNWTPILDGGLPAFVPVIKISNVPKAKLVEAQKIKSYEATLTDYPEIENSLGEIEAYSVKHVLWDPAPSRKNALIQLKIRALDLGANGIINILYTKGSAADVLARNCWASIKIAGTAVVFKN